MKTKLILQYSIVFFLMCFTLTYSQQAHYPFNTNFNDIVNGTASEVFGTPEIITDGDIQAIQLEGDEFLGLPDALHQSLNINQNIEFQLKFKVTNLYQTAPYPKTGQNGELGKRVLISNKIKNINSLGFDIYVEEQEELYQLFISFGDGEREGKLIFNNVVATNEWVTLKMVMNLNDEKPSIIYTLQGDYNNTPIDPLQVDIDAFKKSLNTQRIFIGTDADNDLIGENIAYAETSIDYIKIFNPASQGNANTVKNSLGKLTDYLNGSLVLSDLEKENHYQIITQNWDTEVFAAISPDVYTYIKAYETQRGTVFEFYGELISPRTSAVEKRVQFMLLQWIVDNLYTNSNSSKMEGISFLDHTIFPGAVKTSAPRVMGKTKIDGSYKTNPGYYLNQQENVIRPTGYYAAPGELVEVRLPQNMVNKGVKIRVGAHFIDYREDYIDFQRFPSVATSFKATQQTTTVANPFGGAIYIVLPDGSEFGAVDVEFKNAIKSPYYSTKSNFSNELNQYTTDLADAYVAWVDIESDNFMCTFPIALTEIEKDANKILNPFNSMIGQFNVLTGRPQKRIRSEYVIIEPASYTQGTYPASYPMSIPNGDISAVDAEAIPVSVINPKLFMESYDGTTILHELGHLHNMPTMDGEYETNVDLPAIIAFEATFGTTKDEGIFYSNSFQNLDGSLAALDWILDKKFRNDLPTDYEKVSYQARGYSKYVDIARLFSWEELGSIHGYWYEEALKTGDTGGSGRLTPDEFILVASKTLNFNLAPLLEIWGTVPSEELVNQLKGYTPSDKIKERILYYRSLVPKNTSEYKKVYDQITPNIEVHHRVRYETMLTTYDENMAYSVLKRIDRILCRYFDTNCTGNDAILDQELSEVIIAPNPTKGPLQIWGVQNNPLVTIFDSTGRLIRTLKQGNNSNAITISDLQDGLYFITITDEKNNKNWAKKIIKQ